MSLAMELAPGFEEPVHGSQRTFRAVLDALAHPGTLTPLEGLPSPPAPLNGTLAAVVLTLLDHEVAAYLGPRLDHEDVRRYIAFHTGAPIVSEACEADFLLANAGESLPDIGELKAGTAEYPDRSATLLIGVPAFGDGDPVTLSGPGIAHRTPFSAAGLGSNFWVAARRNHARFPLGVDFVFCGQDAIAGLPRSTDIAV